MARRKAAEKNVVKHMSGEKFMTFLSFWFFLKILETLEISKKAKNFHESITKKHLKY